MKDSTCTIFDHCSSTPDNPNTANVHMGEIPDPAKIVIWLQEKGTAGQSKIPYQKQVLINLNIILLVNGS